MQNGTTVEIWKEIPGYEGYYEASDKGGIRSMPRTIKIYRYGSDEDRVLKGVLLKQATANNGYLFVVLSDRLNGISSNSIHSIGKRITWKHL